MKKSLYDSALTFSNLEVCFREVCKSCKNKRLVNEFLLNKNCNLMEIYLALKNRCYTPNRYRCFIIFEKKERLVMSSSIRDKIVNHFVVNYYLIPLLNRSLIDQNVATRKGMGVSYARRRIQGFLSKLDRSSEIYALKLDISKYFYNIDHDLLMDMLSCKIRDRDILNLIRVIIDETNKPYINDYIRRANDYYGIDIPLYGFHKGLSIGAVTSQFLAIFYLNGLDHYIKEDLHCRFYLRYMDDLIIFSNDKSMLLSVFSSVSVFVSSLRLRLNKKSNLYRLSKGICFIGKRYLLCDGRISVSLDKRTFYRVIKKLEFLYGFNQLMFRRSFGSYYGVIGIRGDFSISSLVLTSSFDRRYVLIRSKRSKRIGYDLYLNDSFLLFFDDRFYPYLELDDFIILDNAGNVLRD